jgi:serine phosphatase RsbU (regulator of sigma subunit)
LGSGHIPKRRFNEVSGPPDSSDASPPRPAASVRVLLIEDDDGDAFLVRDLLERSNGNFLLTRVANLADALLAARSPFDCALLDPGLPDAIGVDALPAILEVSPALAVVVLTGYDNQASGAQALGLGAQDYLTKSSVTEETLTRSLRYAMARRRGEEATRRLREAELMRAENARLERGLLARPIVHNPGLHWATRYQPGGRRALLGGDFFDAIELVDGTVRLVVGDVSGHGPDEAALGVAMRVAWRALVLADQPPDITIPALQRVLEAERQSEEVFVTLCDIQLDAGLVHCEIAVAGHPSPLLLADGDVMELPVDVRGPVLGVFDDAKWPANHVDLGQQWTLIVFTDGIIEGRSEEAGERFETTGLARLALRSMERAGDLESMADRLIAGAEAANGEPLFDDVALLLLSTARRWAH